MLLCSNGYQPNGKCNAIKKNSLIAGLILMINWGQANISYAAASPSDTVKPYAASSMLYDSNFFRQSDSADQVSITGKGDKSEFVKNIAAGFNMNWAIGRQHLVIKTNVNQNWFLNFANLDYLGWNNLAQWNWQIGNNLSGEIGYANIKTLGSFVQLNRLVPNLQNNQNFFANASYLFHPNGKIKLGVFRTENEFDDKSRQFSNNTEDNAEFNLQYLSPTGSILGVRILATDGQYPQRQLTPASTQDNAYTRMNYALTWDWHASSKTSIIGFFGYTQQSYANYSSRDFADITTQLKLNWQASEKTFMELSAQRLINQADNLFASFYLTQGLWFNYTWQSSSKISLTLPMSYQQQQYLGNFDGNVTGVEQQTDKVGSVGLNLTYRPIDNIGIGIVLNYENRDSNYQIRSYQTESAGVNLQAHF